MNYELEVVVIPVSDVDEAKDFYQTLGWRLDADFTGVPDYRVVQLTPPGSTCSIIFGTGVSSGRAGLRAGPAPGHRRHRRGPGRPGLTRRRGQRSVP
jgi:catechol 2,3-dioxygenase-like lactoylglutathione lyase family enzyme